MKNIFAKITAAAWLTLAAAATARTETLGPDVSTRPSSPGGTAWQLAQPAGGAPGVSILSATGFPAEAGGEGFGAASLFSSRDDLGYLPLGYARGVAAGAVAPAPNFPLTSPGVSVPLPEPSSETALYFLSAMVGLAFVVMRRRKVA